jgi:hypothetical protein
MDHQIVKKYSMCGYHEYSTPKPDFLINSLWVQNTPLNVPTGGTHHLVPEPTVNIAMSRLYDEYGQTSHEIVEISGPVRKPYSFNLGAVLDNA